MALRMFNPRTAVQAEVGGQARPDRLGSEDDLRRIREARIAEIRTLLEEIAAGPPVRAQRAARSGGRT